MEKRWISKTALRRVAHVLLVGFCACFPACLLGNAHPCQQDADCKDALICHQNWCVPSRFRNSSGSPDGGEGNSGRDRQSEVLPDGRVLERSAEVPGEAGVAESLPERWEPSPEGNAMEGAGDVGVERGREPLVESIPESCPSICALGETKPCYPGGVDGCQADGRGCQGACKAGLQICYKAASGCPTWSGCFDAVVPVAETCNGQDDDCDGTVDESLTRACYSGPSGTDGKGECKQGMQTCAAGSWGTCSGEVTPQAETCNSKDDDCDGTVDEGCVITIAGDGSFGFLDAKGTAARFSGPSDLLVDPAGNIIVADRGNNRLRKIDPAGNVTTIAGDGTKGSKDGPALQAQLDSPQSLARDAAGNIYFTEASKPWIRVLDTSGKISIFAGSSTPGTQDGSRAAAQFTSPLRGLAFDAQGNLYIVGFGSCRIRKIDPADNVTTIAGSTCGYKDGQGAQAQFQTPWGISADASGNLYVAEFSNHRIRKIDTSLNVSTLAGEGSPGFRDAQGKQALFNNPFRAFSDGLGRLFVADSVNRRVRLIDAQGNVSTFAGDGTEAYRDGSFLQAQFRGMEGLFVDAKGNIYIAETNGSRIRKLIVK